MYSDVCLAFHTILCDVCATVLQADMAARIRGGETNAILRCKLRKSLPRASSMAGGQPTSKAALLALWDKGGADDDAALGDVSGDDSDGSSRVALGARIAQYGKLVAKLPKAVADRACRCCVCCDARGACTLAGCRNTALTRMRCVECAGRLGLAGEIESTLHRMWRSDHVKYDLATGSIVGVLSTHRELLAKVSQQRLGVADAVILASKSVL
jgi:hypothetical protein